MNEVVSVFDLMESGDISGQRAVRDELAALEHELRKTMDAGLAPDDMKPVQAARDAVQAASAILNKIF